MLKKIPKDASVSTDANFFGHLQYRNNIYRLTTKHDSSYVLIKKNKYITEADAKKYFATKKYKSLLKYLIMGTIRSEKDIDNNSRIIQKYQNDDRYSHLNENDIWLFIKNK